MSKKYLLVITGASRGLGKAIALQFCQSACSDSAVKHLRVVLISRNNANLERLRNELHSYPESKTSGTSKGDDGEESSSEDGSTRIFTIQVSYHSVDLADLTQLESRMEEVIAELSHIVDGPEAYDKFIFVNNAGTLGPIGPCWMHYSLTDIQRNTDLNVTSALWLSARVARFATLKTSENRIADSTIVNISSLVAVQAFPSLALYSAGKAARDQYHVAMAMEQEGAAAPIRILNYAPGPLETDMTTEIRQAENLDAGLRPHYEKQLVDPGDSALRLVRLVLEGNFESGAHIDYYDLEQE